MTSTRSLSRAVRSAAAGTGILLAATASLLAVAPAAAVPALDTVVNPNDVGVLGSIDDLDSVAPGWYTDGDAEWQITASGFELPEFGSLAHVLDGGTPINDSLIGTLATGAFSWTTTAGSSTTFNVIVETDSFGLIVVSSQQYPGGHTISLADEWIAVSPTDGVINQGPLGDLLSVILDDNPIVKAYGIGSADSPAVITSITWWNTEYTFDPLDSLVPGTIAITGTPAVGSTLTATSTGWPAGTTFSYEWTWSDLNRGGAIADATGASYTLTQAERGRSIGVRVTGHLDGHSDVTVSSDLPGFVTGGTAPAAPVADSDALGAYLRSNGVTPLSQASAGLPSGPLDPARGYTAEVPFTAGDGFVDVYAYSAPVFVGTFPVVDGVVQVDLTAAQLSALGEGGHTLVLIGASSGQVQAVAFAVAAVLAATGAEVTGGLAAAALLLLLGAGALVVVRRRAGAAA